ncbi:MAG: FadR/GntR family transcriptional regulator [Bacteroidales bacterium]
MELLKAPLHTYTLVDQVEDKLLNYLKESSICVGDSIPNEMELASTIGVARSVLREALSRLKMLGIIETRPRRGMIMTEPSLFNAMRRVVDPRILNENTIFEILQFRIALEIGMCSDLFYNLTESHIQELRDIVMSGKVSENNEYDPASEYDFHAKLYQIAGSSILSEFQEMIYPLMIYIKKTFKELIEPINIDLASKNEIVTHEVLLQYMTDRDEVGFTQALNKHFMNYRILMRNRK